MNGSRRKAEENRLVSRMLILAVCGVLMTLTCAGEEPRGFVPILPDQKIRTFPFAYDVVWSALNAYLEDGGFELLVIDKDTGSIVTDNKRFDPKSEFGKNVIFPEPGERFIDKANYDMVISVKKVGEQETSVEVTVTISKYSRSFMTYYSWTSQLSSGYIEKKFFSDLQSRLRRAAREK